ncbi:MAG: hypothetical protein ACLSAP_11830 [Oscillospiraceae bacterium]
MSDTHGSFSRFIRSSPIICRTATCLSIWGRAPRSEDALALHPNLPLVALRGNCDFCCDFSNQEIFFLGGKKYWRCMGTLSA